MKRFSEGRSIRAALCTVAVATLLSGLSVSPAQAQQLGEIAVPEDCSNAIDALKTEASEKNFRTDQGVDFVCGLGSATIKTFDEKGNAAEMSANLDSARRGPDTELPIGDCTIYDAPVHSIIDVYTVNTTFCLIYGQDYVGASPNDWAKVLSMDFTLNLQQNLHLWTLIVNGDLFSNADLSGFVTLQRQFGVGLPQEVVSTSWAAPNGYTRAYGDLEYEVPSTGGTYAVRVHQMHVNDFDHAFSMDFEKDVALPRFYCPPADQCNYPNGQEAPVF
jgi:hypothetical protein